MTPHEHATSPRLDRRGVLRATVWTTPVLLATVAAPAMAASANPAKLLFDFITVFGGAYDASKPTTLVTKLGIQHVYVAGAATPSTITVVVSFPDGRVADAAPAPVSGSNWVFTSRSTSNGLRHFTFTYTTPLAPGSSTSQLEFQVAIRNYAAGAMAVSATAGGSHATTANGSTSYYVP